MPDRFIDMALASAGILALIWLILDFAREAASLDDAIVLAIADARRAGACVDHVEPDLVNCGRLAPEVWNQAVTVSKVNSSLANARRDEGEIA